MRAARPMFPIALLVYTFLFGIARVRARVRLVPSSCNSTLMSYDFSSEYYRHILDKAKQIKITAIQKKYSYGKIKVLPSGSGPGSETGDATASSLEFLKDVIPRFDIKSVVDVPCGDVNWQFHSWEMDSLEQYVGLDIVKSVIRLNSMRFAHHRNKMFVAWDFVSCGIPRWHRRDGSVRAVDMVHMRDVLQHISVENGLRAIDNVCRSGATRYFVTTTYPEDITKDAYKTTKLGTPDRAVAPRLKVTVNNHPQDGGWYPNNLALPPFKHD